MKSDVDITFFIPCYNEEKLIEKTLDIIVSAVASRKISYEILIFNDASTDFSQAVIQRYIQAHPEIPISVVVNDRNRGLGANYFRGARVAKGKCYLLINGDNAEPISAIETLLDQMGSADMIIPHFGTTIFQSSTNQDNRRFRRRLTSVVFSRLVSFLSGHRMKYFNGPVLHRTENVLRWKFKTSGFAYQAELLCRAVNHGCSYREVKITNIDRDAGKTSAFTPGNIISVSLSLIKIFSWRISGHRTKF